jgi:hypothetical protein
MTLRIILYALPIAATGCSYWQEPPLASATWTPTISVPAEYRGAVDAESALHPASPQGGRSIEERLRELQSLHDKGLISTEDLRQRRTEILKEL